MSALKTTADQRALAGRPTGHDGARALLGQVMGLVAITVWVHRVRRLPRSRCERRHSACGGRIPPADGDRAPRPSRATCPGPQWPRAPARHLVLSGHGPVDFLDARDVL